MTETAIEDEHGRTFTKKEVELNAFMVAGALMKLGVKAGEAIVIATKNCYAGIVTMMGANAIGVKSILGNHLASDDELCEMVEKFHAKILFVSDKNLTEARSLAKKCSSVERIVVIDRTGDFQAWDDARCIAFPVFYEFGIFANSVELSKEIQKYSMYDEEPLIYLQTSGSASGKPKTLPFKNSAIYGALIFASNSTGTQTNDKTINRVLCALPYRLPYGWMTIFVNLMGGNTVMLAPGTDAEDIANYYFLKPSYIYGTPTMLKVFMDTVPPEAELSSITAFFASGFSISESWYQEGIEFFRKHGSNAEIRNNYGIGEGLCIGTASDGLEHIPGKCGKFYIGPDWLIVDENLNEVKYGEAGEVLVASPTLCQGYFGNEEATKKAFISLNGKTYYRTDDQARLFEDGTVQYEGRMGKRFYQPKGAPDKVNCETVESAIRELPHIDDCAVVSIPDPTDGTDMGVAFIVVNKKYPLPPKCYAIKVAMLLQEKLLPYQRPALIRTICKIPMRDSGKPDHLLLAEMAKEPCIF